MSQHTWVFFFFSDASAATDALAYPSLFVSKQFKTGLWYPDQEAFDQGDVAQGKVCAVFSRPEDVGLRGGRPCQIQGCSDYCSPNHKTPIEGQRDHVRTILDHYGGKVVLVKWSSAEGGTYSYLPESNAVYSAHALRFLNGKFQVMFTTDTASGGAWYDTPSDTEGCANHLGLDPSEAARLLKNCVQANGSVVKIGSGGFGDCVKLALTRHIFNPSKHFCAADCIPGHSITLEEASRILQAHNVGWLEIARGWKADQLRTKHTGPALLVVDLKNASTGHCIYRTQAGGPYYDAQLDPGRAFPTLESLGVTFVFGVGIIHEYP